MLKRATLLFDKIYIGKSALNNKNTDQKLYDYLINNQVVTIYDVFARVNNDTMPVLQQTIIKEIESAVERMNIPIGKIEVSKTAEEIEKSMEEIKGMTLYTSDLVARLMAIKLSDIHSAEFYPILKSANSFRENKRKHR